MKLSDGKIATPCITEESMKCVEFSLEMQGRTILKSKPTSECQDVHGKVFTSHVVVWRD